MAADTLSRKSKEATVRTFILATFMLLQLLSAAVGQSAPEAVSNRSDAQRQEEPGKNTTDKFAVPVRILEQPEETEDAKRRERVSDDRENDNLLTQKRVADATDEIVYLTKAQLVLGLLGTCALLYSLHLNRRATKAAVDAVDVTRQIGEAQVRAYVGATSFDARLDQASGGLIVTPIIKNTGSSPAFIRRMAITSVMHEPGKKPCFNLRGCFDSRGLSLSAQEHFQGMRTLVPRNYCMEAFRKTQSIHLVIYVEFDDVFTRDKHRIYEAAFEVAVNHNIDAAFHLPPEGPLVVFYPAREYEVAHNE